MDEGVSDAAASRLGASQAFGPDVLFLIAKFALEDRKSLTEKPNTAPHKAFLAHRHYAQLVSNAAQREQLMDVAVCMQRAEGIAYSEGFCRTTFRLPNSSLHRGGDLPALVYASGHQEWWVAGQIHRSGGLPAVVGVNGAQYWFERGNRHRIGAPAVCNKSPSIGSEEWWVNGKLHRDDGGPAMIWSNGSEFWYKEGSLHRGGCLPAVIRPTGDYEWWVNGVRLQ